MGTNRTEYMQAWEKTPAGKASRDRSHAKYWNTRKGRAVKMLVSTRARAKRNGLDFDLSNDWLVKRLKAGCEITGQPFKIQKYVQGSGNRAKGAKPFSPSIDRIDPSKGYIETNCRVILHCINLFKYTMTDNEMEQVALAVAAGLKRKREEGI